MTGLRVQQALNRLVKGRTAFIVTHRLSTTRNADLIVVIDNGRVIEVGRHDELLARGGKYAELYLNSLSGYPGLPEREPDLGRFPDFLRSVQQRRFDLVIQMQGSGLLSNSVVSLFGARHLAGYFVPDQFRPEVDRFLPHRKVTHEVWRCLSLLRHLGAPPQGEDLDDIHSEKDEADLRAIESEIPTLTAAISDPFVCIHPGACEAFRRWPAKEFATVADHLTDESYAIVLAGSKSERSLTDDVARLLKGASINLAG